MKILQKFRRGQSVGMEEHERGYCKKLETPASLGGAPFGCGRFVAGHSGHAQHLLAHDDDRRAFVHARRLPPRPAAGAVATGIFEQRRHPRARRLRAAVGPAGVDRVPCWETTSAARKLERTRPQACEQLTGGSVEVLRELRGGAGRGLGAAAAFVQHGGVAALDDAVVLRVVPGSQTLAVARHVQGQQRLDRSSSMNSHSDVTGRRRYSANLGPVRTEVVVGLAGRAALGHAGARVHDHVPLAVLGVPEEVLAAAPCPQRCRCHLRRLQCNG